MLSIRGGCLVAVSACNRRENALRSALKQMHVPCALTSSVRSYLCRAELADQHRVLANHYPQKSLLNAHLAHEGLGSD
jgi:hypothetical protein